MISDKYKFITIHPLKTGATTMCSVLSTYYCDPNTSKHATLKMQYKEDYTKIGFIRNPWDKMVSHYFYHSKLYFGDISFEKYIEKFYNGERITTQAEGPFHLPFFLNPKDELEIDFTVHFSEFLQMGWDIICHELGLHSCDLPHLNKTEHKPFIEYYNDETWQMVEEKFAEDLTYLFG